MEWVDGISLRELIQTQGRLKPEEVLQILAPICLAVQAAHDAGFIHRDLKSSNILVTSDAGGRSAKLLDFGIAGLLHGDPNGQGLTQPGMVLGTMHNMAPEQIRAEYVDQRTDVYALGVVLFQMLTGQHPFHAEDPTEIALMHLQAPVPRPSRLAPVSAAVDKVVLRCLEKAREQRFSTVSELLVALRGAVHQKIGDARVTEEQALAVYVEAITAEDEDDDAVFDQAEEILETASQILARRHYAFPLRTATSLLGVIVLSDDANAAHELEEADIMLRELSTLISEDLPPTARVSVRISRHVGSVVCVHSADGIEVSEGELMDLSAWPSESQFS
jgi:serine/threonine-protein kinase